MFGGIRSAIISVKANDPHLSNLIAEEKDKISSIKAVSTANTNASKYLTQWGEGEHEDIKDITYKHSLMSEEFSMMLMEFEYAQNDYREVLKKIRALTDEIAAMKHKLKTFTDKYDKNKRQGKPVQDVLVQIRALDISIKNEVCTFEVLKRSLLQEGMLSQFNGILKFAKKAEQYAIQGNNLAFEIPQISLNPNESLPFYNGQSVTSAIQKDFQRNLYAVKFTAMEAPVRTSSNNTLNSGIPNAIKNIDQTKTDKKETVQTNSSSKQGSASWARFPPAAPLKKDSLPQANLLDMDIVETTPIKPPRSSNVDFSHANTKVEIEEVEDAPRVSYEEPRVNEQTKPLSKFDAGMLPAEFADNPW